MNKDRTLLLIETNPDTDIFFNNWIYNGYKADILFRKICKPLRAIRRIWLKHNLPFYGIWLGDWIKDLSKYETLIIHSSYLTRYLPFFLCKKNGKLRIINWYWNTIDKNTIPIKTDNQNIEYWSFDKADCNKYNMKYNIQYYIKQNDTKTEKKEYDIYFIGRNKGRLEQINHIKNLANKNKLICNFTVINDNDNGIIPYNEVKKEIKKTKCILEINKENQIGLTLRALESLFFETKLITNNRFIKNTNIYNKNNIFILGEDEEEKLFDFINNPYDHNVDYLKNEYDIDKWFDNFFEGE